MSGQVEATRENFRELVAGGTVLVDVWGPDCAPCIQLRPDVERIAEGRDLTLVMLEAPKARRICIEMRVMGMPTFLLFANGEEVSRLTGQGLTPPKIEAWLDEALAKVPAA
ncbi:MAG: thioredoxin family protein [Candidatus Dormibacteria bacterium]